VAEQKKNVGEALEGVFAKMDYDPQIQRHYVPLPGGWEVQTKGKGSSFRLADINTDERYLVIDDHLHLPLMKMAVNIRAALHDALRWRPVSELPPIGKRIVLTDGSKARWLGARHSEADSTWHHWGALGIGQRIGTHWFLIPEFET
jgi:hypothetical protein